MSTGLPVAVQIGTSEQQSAVACPRSTVVTRQSRVACGGLLDGALFSYPTPASPDVDAGRDARGPDALRCPLMTIARTARGMRPAGSNRLAHSQWSSSLPTFAKAVAAVRRMSGL